jgi:hypothetical protein
LSKLRLTFQNVFPTGTFPFKIILTINFIPSGHARHFL